MKVQHLTVENLDGNGERGASAPAIQILVPPLFKGDAAVLRAAAVANHDGGAVTRASYLSISSSVNSSQCSFFGGSSSAVSPLASTSVSQANVDTPSSTYEAAVCAELQRLLERCEQSWMHTMHIPRVILRSVALDQNCAIAATCAMLIISCILYPMTQTILCTILFFVLYGLCVLLQAYHFWARVTEMKYRTASVTREVLARWWRRVQEMPLRRSQTAEERRRVFIESFSQLPASAFRMVAVVDERTGRLKHIHKSLMVKMSKRLDESTLKVRSYLEPTSICKLVDVMRITLECDAIVLKPLTDRARPPRLPNLLLSDKPFVEDEDTTDSSDHERESRTVLGGGNTITVSHHMEYFVHRVFLLVWAAVMVLTIGTGVMLCKFVRLPLGEGVFLDPAVAALGLLPLNAIVLNRVLIFYANVYLDKLFHYMVSRRSYALEDRLPRFSFWSTLVTMARVVCRMPPPNGGRNPLVFSTSLVDVFGMATVVAMLDQTGIVTDMVLVPKQVFLLKSDPQQQHQHQQSSSSGESGDDDDGTTTVKGCFSQRSERDARERRRDMHKQIKRKKYQERRFLELRLMQSTRQDLAVEFADEKARHKHNSHLKPLCLAILVHALAREPTQLATWTEPFRFCDRSLLWARAMHWIPRACGFHDRVAHNFLILARIFVISTSTGSGYRDTYPEQACSYLVEGSDGALHLFTIGTPYLVCHHSTTHWTGTTIEEFDAHDKAEVLYMGKHQWEEGATLETVALSHRILPERYRRYVATLPRHAHHYNEFFFRNGAEVNSTTAKKAQVERRHRRQQRAAAKAARSGVAAPHPQAAPQSADSRQEPRGESGTSRCRVMRHDGGGADTDDGAPIPSAAMQRERTEAAVRAGDREMGAEKEVGAVGVSDDSTMSSYDADKWGGDRDIAVDECDISGRDIDRQRQLCGTPRRRCRSAPPVRSTRPANVQPPRNRSFGAAPTDVVADIEGDDCITVNTFIWLMATTSHTFLGLIGLQDSVRPNVQSTMSLLDESGVRCMYFYAGTERQTKSFGSRVGLDTDWNCCISLKEDAVALDPHSIRAQLPFGIKSIRKHILHVDPIPLQVSLFSHALGVSKRAMLSVLQDNHEVVVAVGSVFNHSNVRSFVQADLSIGVLPTRRGTNADKEGALKHTRVVEPSDFAAANSLNRDIPLYRNVAELIGCSCSLRAPPTTSILPIVAMMIRQARLRLSGISNGAEFVMHANFFLVMVNTSSLIVGVPLLLTPSVTVFELYVLIPILALCCTYTAYAGMDAMRVMPSRHNHFVRRAIFRHSAVVWCLRYAISVVALLALGITASTKLCKVRVLKLITMEEATCMSSGQGYAALTFNYWLMVHCWTHISRHHPISLTFSLKLEHGRRSTYLFRSFRWVAASFLVTLLSIIIVVLDTPKAALHHAFFPSVPHFIVSLLFPVLILALDWPVKRWRERRFTNMQKFRKLSYGTRLGMHSPRGDYEPEGITYTHTSTVGGAGREEAAPAERVGLLKRVSEWFYRFSSMRGGKLELNCVCCDHIGGNYATYHTTANV
ncbi:conserved hypothetical protein [Leishmania infantum JPCM5]|uniref:Uncharacterized protein n=2 Tax=Leishmania infantum TaxID=5671 RepID=A4HXK0_LEIIN|nr:conserved hypothetical protein [Leishmania infantum JPCM5]CAM59819.2 conserved hypothetical protein [Leishmania infantum JPCM5]|eukprot:XP_001464791.2 conserved hypothetical protein [Leishmania infantum JPCM5]